MRRHDRSITIQRRRETTQDSYGQPITAWVAISHRRPATYRVLGGDERFTAAQWIARQQVQFEIRMSADVSAMGPTDRILFPPPADQNAQEPPPHTVYDVIDVAETVRGRKLTIKAVRRSEIAS